MAGHATVDAYTVTLFCSFTLSTIPPPVCSRPTCPSVLPRATTSSDGHGLFLFCTRVVFPDGIAQCCRKGSADYDDKTKSGGDVEDVDLEQAV